MSKKAKSLKVSKRKVKKANFEYKLTTRKHRLADFILKNHKKDFLALAITGIVISTCFLAFGLYLLLSVNCITDGTVINTNYLWNPDVGKTKTVLSVTYSFLFGLYFYSFLLTPVNGTSPLAYAQYAKTKTLPAILKDYTGPHLSAIGICFVLCELLLVVYFITVLVLTKHGTKLLTITPYGKQAYKFSLHIFSNLLAIVLVTGSLVELNFIPSSAMVQSLLKDIHINANSIKASTVTNLLHTVETTGLSLPVALFVMVHLLYNVNHHTIIVFFYSPVWSFVATGLLIAWNITATTLFSVFFKKRTTQYLIALHQALTLNIPQAVADLHKKYRLPNRV